VIGRQYVPAFIAFLPFNYIYFSIYISDYMLAFNIFSFIVFHSNAKRWPSNTLFLKVEIISNTSLSAAFPFSSVQPKQILSSRHKLLLMSL
jgi:hypothetical protein